MAGEKTKTEIIHLYGDILRHLHPEREFLLAYHLASSEFTE